MAIRSSKFVNLLVLLMFLVSGSQVFAQTPMANENNQPNRAIAFYPEETGEGTFISIELEPGESTSVNVIVGNAGDIDQAIRTYAVPALTAVGGGFVIAEHGTEQDMQTGWIGYPETELELAPTEGRVLPVSISVPEGTAPGEYVTGIAAEQRDTFEVPGSDLFVQRIRWSIPILITVPGERHPAFDVTGTTLENVDGNIVARVGIANTGNVIVRPAGQVRLIGSDGTVLGTADVAMGSVYTGTSTTIDVGWQNVAVSESYSIEVNLTAEEGATSVEKEFPGLMPVAEDGSATPVPEPLVFAAAELVPLTQDTPPSTLQLNAEIANNAEPIEEARVTIVTYRDGEEVDRYPILQAIKLETGITPIEARYSLPGGFTQGTYTFEVTIETGDAGTQSVLVTQPIDYELVVP